MSASHSLRIVPPLPSQIVLRQTDAGGLAGCQHHRWIARRKLPRLLHQAVGSCAGMTKPWVSSVRSYSGLAEVDCSHFGSVPQ